MENSKEIEELTWKAINDETKKIRDRDQHFKDILTKLKIYIVEA